MERRNVVGYEEFYEMDNDFKIYNKITGKEKLYFIRKGTSSVYVGLQRNGKTDSVKVNALIKKTYPENKVVTEDLDNEEWKDICGFKGCYQISSFGRIRSLDRCITQAGTDRFMEGRYLSLKRNNGRGYLNVSLQDGEGSTKTNYYIHILVASHFIENTHNKPTVNHKDGNKNNNHVSNLEWATQKEQMKHAFDNKLSVPPETRTGEDSHLSKLTESQVMEIYYNNVEKVGILAKIYNVDRHTITSIRNNKSWKHLNLSR